MPFPPSSPSIPPSLPSFLPRAHLLLCDRTRAAVTALLLASCPRYRSCAGWKRNWWPQPGASQRGTAALRDGAARSPSPLLAERGAVARGPSRGCGSAAPLWGGLLAPLRRGKAPGSSGVLRSFGGNGAGVSGPAAAGLSGVPELRGWGARRCPLQRPSVSASRAQRKQTAAEQRGARRP